MSIHTEIVTQASQNGPALPPHANGLPVSAVNQSPAAAQIQYPNGYSAYSQVAYGAAYSNSVGSLPPPYYTPPPPQRNDQALAPPQHDPPLEHPPLMQEHFPESELRYTQQLEHAHDNPQRTPAADSPPPSHTPVAAGPSTSTSNHSGSKRKEKPAATSAAAGAASGDEGPPPSKRRRATVRAPPKDADNEDDDVGPGGGAKHWTVDEKTRLFSWILGDDERWEQFGSKMNVIFREGSEKLFNSRKSFTALKSCYHRNLDVFKQIFLFEAFLARPPQSEAPPGTPSSSTSAREVSDILHAPVPASFDTSQERQAFLDKKLDAARLLEIPIANLSVKVIDNWHLRGWYTIFKRRFKEDAKTGLPVPSHEGAGTGWSAIPPPLVKSQPEDDAPHPGDTEHEHEHEHDPDPDSAKDTPHSPPSAHSPPGAQRAYTLLTFPSTPKPAMSRVPAPASPNVRNGNANVNVNGHAYAPPRAQSQRPPAQTQTQTPYAHAHSAQSSPQLTAAYTYPHPPPPPPAGANGAFYASPPADYQAQQQQAHFHAQTLQALTHLTGVAQTLLGTCTTLTELVRAQVEDGRARTELLRKREEREAEGQGQGSAEKAQGGGEALGRTQKASLAMDLLSNPGVGDEVKNVAADYLKKLFQ